MVSLFRTTNSGDSTRNRLKNKFSMEGLRNQLFSPFLPATPTTFAHTSTFEGLSQRQHRKAHSPEFSMTLPVSASHHAESWSPALRNSAYSNYHSASDIGSHYDASDEPLMDEASFHCMARSARPLMKGTSECKIGHEPTSLLDQSTVAYDIPYLSNLHHRTDSAHSNTDRPLNKRASIASVTSASVTNSPRPGSSTSSNLSRGSSATASSVHTLAPLQTKGVLDENDRLDPVLEDDPGCFNLLEPASSTSSSGFSLEKRVEDIMSRAHLEEILNDPATMLKFTSFLNQYRPKSMPLLVYYLDSIKSLRALRYANAIAEALTPIPGLSFTNITVDRTINTSLQYRADEALNHLVKEDLPAYVAYVFIQVVNLSLRHRVSGTMPSHLREASEGLAEVFCLTDPSRKDNPIVFASEEFHRTTQYGVDYAIGQNCRFVQGPKTDGNALERLRANISAGQESVEILLNYRRDGSPFVNLLMVAPLVDNRGNTRYFIGAQVDISGLCRDSTDLDAFRRMIERQNPSSERTSDSEEQLADGSKRKGSHSNHSVDEFRELSEMFNENELDVVRSHGGRMHAGRIVKNDEMVVLQRPRLRVRDPSTESKHEEDDSDEVPAHYGTPARGRLLHVYQNYLLVRPCESLRIIFASPALRTPGMLQSPFLSRIGGSSRVREELKSALSSGRGVTAKIRWSSGRPIDGDGRARWVHCTPLLGKNGTVGVWMIVIIDDESYVTVHRGFKAAPPVPPASDGAGSKTSSLWCGDSDNQSLGSQL